MKIKWLISILILLSIQLSAQTKYEHGYFITNNGEKRECLIKNEDWENNPDSFTYRLTSEAETNIGKLEDIQEFGIGELCKFIRFEGSIDRSRDLINFLSDIREPIWSEEILFLKVLIEGKASLYFYKDNEFERFFFKNHNAPISQLVYKRFNQNRSVKENHAYREQLWSKVRSKQTTLEDIQTLSYKEKSLIDYFEAYNKIEGEEYWKPTVNDKRDYLNITFSGGYNFSKLIVYNSSLLKDGLEFSRASSFYTGIGLEYILPFRNNKWALIADLQYNYYKTIQEEVPVAKFSFIELPIGLRHYFFINDDLHIYVDGRFKSGVTADIDNYLLIKEYQSLDVTSRSSLDFGGGIEYKRISAGCRYNISREMLGSYMKWSTDYYGYSFFIAYKVFKVNKK
jgi:hypothetical protein